MKKDLNLNNIKRPNDEDTNYIQKLNSQSKLLTEFYKRIFINNYSDNINYNVKYEGKNKGQYGYYISFCGIIWYLLKQFESRSFLDLGSGAGVMLYIIQENNYSVRVKGYEIEPTLVKIANKLIKDSTKVKNILTLKKEDIQAFDTIYFWEPLADKKLAEKFANNLLKILQPGQIVIYKRAGHIGQFLEESNKLECGRFENLNLYRLK